MRIDCMILQNRSAAELRSLAADVESMGFDGIWVADHLTSVDGDTLLEAWTTLAALGEHTSRVQLGVLVTNITYRNPAVVARQALTVDHFSGCRLELGVGAAGTRPGDARSSGIAEWPPRERVERFGEFVAAVAALTGPEPHHQGDWYSSAEFAPGPHRSDGTRMPLVIAAQRPRTLAVAARHADCLSVMGGWGKQGDELVRSVAALTARFDELCHDAGRDPRQVRRSMLVGRTGIPWWASLDAFDEFVGAFGEAGITEYVVYAPPTGPPGWDKTFRDFMPQALARRADVTTS